jgi:hypothetical protein
LCSPTFGAPNTPTATATRLPPVDKHAIYLPLAAKAATLP